MFFCCRQGNALQEEEGIAGDEKLRLLVLLFGAPEFSLSNFKAQTEVSSQPERTRISCHAALDNAACAPFRKEGRMKCTNAIKVHRKSGVA